MRMTKRSTWDLRSAWWHCSSNTRPPCVLQILIFKGSYLCIGSFCEDCLAWVCPDTFTFKSKFVANTKSEVAVRAAPAWFVGRHPVTGRADDGAHLVDTCWTRRSVTGARWGVRGKQLSYFIGEPPSPPTLTVLPASRHCGRFYRRSQGPSRRIRFQSRVFNKWIYL